MNKRILIVDDEPDLRQTIAEQLELHEDFAVACAGAVREAIRRIAEESFDLVILVSACRIWTDVKPAS